MEAARARYCVRAWERRELLAHAMVGLPFVVVAVLLAVVRRSTGRCDATDVVLLVVAATSSGRLEFETGAGFMNPAQLIFVPMLFVLPPAIVPLVVARRRSCSTGCPRCSPDGCIRSACSARPCDAWFAVGPVVVFLLADVGEPRWSDWPIYLLALLAQFALRPAELDRCGEWLAHGVAPKLQLGVLREVWLVDALLAPVGLLAAFSSVRVHHAYLLVLPLAMLLAVFARERRGRIGNEIELSATYRGTALLLGDVISSDDELTGRHSQGVVVLALAMADELHLDEEQRRLVEFAAMLHDIGKMETPREILHKPGPLSPEEWEEMRAHTIAGQAMLDRVGGTLHDVGLVVRSSRERYAGDGYPDALAGLEIPLAARVVAVAAAYSAMTSRRPYRAALSPEEAIAELRVNGGTQFDPQIVAAACVVLDRGLPDLTEVVADVLRGTDL